jgi:hypothetical protein
MHDSMMQKVMLASSRERPWHANAASDIALAKMTVWLAACTVQWGTTATIAGGDVSLHTKMRR